MGKKEGQKSRGTIPLSRTDSQDTAEIRGLDYMSTHKTTMRNFSPHSTVHPPNFSSAVTFNYCDILTLQHLTMQHFVSVLFYYGNILSL
jgi:hypothetical protein